MRNFILLALLVISSFVANSAEWVRIIDPKSAKLVVSSSKKVVEIETWKRLGHKNFVNISFWGSRGPIGRLYVKSENIGFGKPSWPVFSLSPYIGEYITGDAIEQGFAGSNVLVRNGLVHKQPRTFFTKRRCPRTGVGVLPNGKIIVIVTTRSNLKEFAERFIYHGARFAVNVDGGSSTMFIEEGEIVWSSKRSAVPVILSW